MRNISSLAEIVMFNLAKNAWIFLFFIEKDIISVKYFNLANILLKNLAKILFKYIPNLINLQLSKKKANNYFIDLFII